MVKFDGSQESVAAMMTTIMKGQNDMKRMMRDNEKKEREARKVMLSEVRGAASKAEHAAEVASQAKEAAAALRREVDGIKNGGVSDEMVEKAISKAVAEKLPKVLNEQSASSAGTSWPVIGGGQGAASAGGGGKGKGMSKGGTKKLEQRSRTIRFAPFPKYTKEAVIKQEKKEAELRVQPSSTHPVCSQRKTSNS